MWGPWGCWVFSEGPVSLQTGPCAGHPVPAPPGPPAEPAPLAACPGPTEGCGRGWGLRDRWAPCALPGDQGAHVSKHAHDLHLTAPGPEGDRPQAEAAAGVGSTTSPQAPSRELGAQGGMLSPAPNPEAQKHGIFVLCRARCQAGSSSSERSIPGICGECLGGRGSLQRCTREGAPARASRTTPGPKANNRVFIFKINMNRDGVAPERGAGDLGPGHQEPGRKALLHLHVVDMSVGRPRLRLQSKLGSAGTPPPQCQRGLARHRRALLSHVLSRPGPLGDNKRPRFALHLQVSALDAGRISQQREMRGCWVPGTVEWGRGGGREGLTSVHLPLTPPHPRPCLMKSWH